jgi:hypothetical protein
MMSLRSSNPNYTYLRSCVVLTLVAFLLHSCSGHTGAPTKQPVRILLNGRMDIDSMFLCDDKLEVFDAFRSAGLEPQIDSHELALELPQHEKVGVVAATNAVLFGIDSGYFQADIVSKNLPLLSATFTKAHVPRSRWAAIKDSFDRAREGRGWCHVVQQHGREVLRGVAAFDLSTAMFRCDTAGFTMTFFKQGNILNLP